MQASSLSRVTPGVRLIAWWSAYTCFRSSSDRVRPAPRVLRAAERNGFVREGVLRSSAWVMGEFTHLLHLAQAADGSDVLTPSPAAPAQGPVEAPPQPAVNPGRPHRRTRLRPQRPHGSCPLAARSSAPAGAPTTSATTAAARSASIIRSSANSPSPSKASTWPPSPASPSPSHRRARLALGRAPAPARVLGRHPRDPGALAAVHDELTLWPDRRGAALRGRIRRCPLRPHRPLSRVHRADHHAAAHRRPRRRHTSTGPRPGLGHHPLA